MEEAIRNIIAAQMKVDISSISDDTDLLSELNMDSLDIVDIVVTLEDYFNISIPDEYIANVKTVSDISREIGTLCTEGI